MANTPWIPTVKNIANGEFVQAETVNPIIQQLTKREQYLYEKFAELEGKSVLIAYDILVKSTSTAAANSVVFYDISSGLDLAQIGFSTQSGSTFTPLNDSFTFGIAKAVNVASGVKKADVYLNGLIESVGIVASLLQVGEALTLGPLYLSKTQPGKLTAVPGGLSIYIGYALTADKFYLSPNNEVLNQFFFNYKFNLIERPAGTPRLVAGTWSVDLPDLTALGWINAVDSPFNSLAPAGANFYYNIPAEADLNLDASLTAEQRREAMDLHTALPPYPEHFTFMLINGLYQRAYSETYPDGKFIINATGIWWVGNGDGHQPWASDLIQNISSSIGVIATGPAGFVDGEDIPIDNNPFVVGDKLKFNSLDNFIFNPVTIDTFYYVVEAASDHIKISDTLGGSAITFDQEGSRTYVEFTPNIWTTFKGSDYLRPRMNLQFVKINPDYKLTTVSSLSSGNDSIKLVQLANENIPANTGDIKIITDINTSIATENPATGTFVKSVGYNNTTGDIQVVTGSGVTDIIEGTGIRASKDVTGKVTLSVSNFSFAGVVSDIEPENSRLETLGLHYYSNLTQPATSQPNALVGKFLLPDNLPTANLQLSLMLFAKTLPSAGQTVKFHFEYSVSAPNIVLSETRIQGNNGNDITVAFPTGYQAKQPILVSPTTLIIPSTDMKGSAFVNFRLERKDSTYLGDIGIIGISWKIG